MGIDLRQRIVAFDQERLQFGFGQEHYAGSVCKANDGNVYLVCGHNHNSIVRVDGLEKMQRAGGAIAVTGPDIDRTEAWEITRAAPPSSRPLNASPTWAPAPRMPVPNRAR